VLITPDNKDFFYICPVHLKDRGFCTPIVDEEEVAAKKRKEEMDREIEQVKLEYEEKMRKKEKSKDKKDNKRDKKKDDDSKKAEKEKDDKIKSIQAAAAEPKSDDSPRIFALNKTFFQMRVDRISITTIAKRNRERLKDSSIFPSAPSTEL